MGIGVFISELGGRLGRERVVASKLMLFIEINRVKYGD